MAEHIADEEQLETLKRWWTSYGRQAVVALVVTVGGWFGWEQWQNHRQQQREAASLVYSEMLDALGRLPAVAASEAQRAAITGPAATLKRDHAGSSYADYAGLVLARLAVADHELDTAASELQAVMDATRDPGLALLARLRLARVEIARERYPTALALLEVEVPAALASGFAEVRGDLHLRKGDLDAARAAYRAALDGLGEDETNSRPLLAMKLNKTLPAQAVVPPAAEENSR